MDFAQARHNMVESQIRTNRVTDPLLIDAMDSLQREMFAPEKIRERAYVDDDLIVAPGRILMEPRVLARLLQAALVQDTDVALVVGGASGYEAAVLARLASAVFVVESESALVSSAMQAVKTQNIDTVTMVEGPLVEGHKQHAPYDVILLNGAVNEIPESLTSQLGEGGRLLAVVSGQGVGRAVMVRRLGDTFSTVELFDASVSELPEFESAPTFRF